MKLRYFAWLRTGLGKTEETLAKPDHVTNVEQLLDWLSDRGEPYRSVLERRAAIRAAVNHDHVTRTHPVSDSDEVALFPPVTGG